MNSAAVTPMVLAMDDHINPAASKSSEVGGKYLTLRIGEQHYGIPVLRTREIIRLPKITPVPQMPGHVSGVINLRGRVISVVDLRTIFALPEAASRERACIVVVHLRTEANRDSVMGIIVDAVDEVRTFAPTDIEPPPELGAGRLPHIVGMAKVNGDVNTLLDLDQLLAA